MRVTGIILFKSILMKFLSFIIEKSVIFSSLLYPGFVCSRSFFQILRTATSSTIISCTGIRNLSKYLRWNLSSEAPSCVTPIIYSPLRSRLLRNWLLKSISGRRSMDGILLRSSYISASFELGSTCSLNHLTACL